MTRQESIVDRILSDAKCLEWLGYEVFGVFLQGSQNYKLDDELSDIDTKAIVLPKYHDLIFGTEPTSTTYVMSTGEHIDIQDIRSMFDKWKKQAVNYTEVLFSQCYYINPKYLDIANRLFNARETIAHANPCAAMNNMVGIIKQKQHALCTTYLETANDIAKYGYSPKALYTMQRLQDFMQRYAAGESFETALIANNRDKLIETKRTPAYTVEEAVQLSNHIVAWADAFNKEYQSAHKGEHTPIDDLLNQTIADALQVYYYTTWTKEQMSLESMDK